MKGAQPRFSRRYYSSALDARRAKSFAIASASAPPRRTITCNPVEPFVTKIENGRSTSLGIESGTERQHIGCVTVVQGNRVIQVNERGVEESSGVEPSRAHGAVVCLTFDTEDGRRFFRTYEFSMGRVTITTSEPQPVAPWEDNPALGITPSRLWHG